MRCHHPKNERIKRRYLQYMREARRYSEDTVDAAAAALARFEAYTKYRDFHAFHIEQAIGFKAHLRDAHTGEPLSSATMYAILKALRSFFQWLADQPGYRSRISYSDAQYFNLDEKTTRVARTRRESAFPSLEQIRHTLTRVPGQTAIDRRDRALIAFTLLTGARDSATASLRFKHIDLARNLLNQDAREVDTKFSKTIVTSFFPVGEDIQSIVVDWVCYLQAELLWGPDDPLFPATEIALIDGKFFANGLARKHWSSTGPIRNIFKAAFTAAGLPYFNPHSFRKTLVQLGERTCKTPEEFKAWSQNLGHEKVLTTFSSYGQVPSSRQAEIMARLAQPASSTQDDKIVEIVQEVLRRQNRK
jgi:integrase